MSLALAFLLAFQPPAPAATFSDPLFRRYWDKLDQAKTLSFREELEIKARFGVRKFTAFNAYQKPFLSRADNFEQDGTLLDSEGDDGKHAWTFNGPRGFVSVVDSYHGFMDSDEIIDGFLHPDGSGKQVYAARVGASTIDSREVVGFSIWPGKATDKPPRQILYLDASTALPAFSRIPGTDTSYSSRYTEFKVDATLDPDLFVNHHGLPQNHKPDFGLLEIGSTVPNIIGVTTKEERFDLSKTLADSKYVLVNIWGVGCQPCLEELPELQKIAKEYRGRGLNVVTIEQGSHEKAVVEVLKKLNVDLCAVYGQSTQPDAVVALKATPSIPVTYLLDHNGRVVKRYADANVDLLRSDLESVFAGTKLVRS